MRDVRNDPHAGVAVKLSVLGARALHSQTNWAVPEHSGSSLY